MIVDINKEYEFRNAPVDTISIRVLSVDSKDDEDYPVIIETQSELMDKWVWTLSRRTKTGMCNIDGTPADFDLVEVSPKKRIQSHLDNLVKKRESV